MITLKDLLDNRKAALLNYELNPELQVKFSGDSLRSEDALLYALLQGAYSHGCLNCYYSFIFGEITMKNLEYIKEELSR